MSATVRDLLLLFALLAGVTIVAELAGAANLGTALSFGVIAFMGGVVALILRR